MYNDEEYLYHNETYTLIGIAMDIHRTLGKGFLEVVYKDAFEYELKQKRIFFEREKQYEIDYKGSILPHCYYADFVVGGKIILELKSKAGIIEQHQAQILNYMAISKLQVGLIINFHDSSLQYKRMALSR